MCATYLMLQQAHRHSVLQTVATLEYVLHLLTSKSNVLHT